jgi:GABA(A) receptor-associated protein
MFPKTAKKRDSTFQREYSFERRKGEADRVLQKYTDRVPVIVEKSKDSILPDLDNRKFLVPKDLTVGQFIWVIRKRIRLAPEQAIFIFVDNTLPPQSQTIAQVYQDHVDSDGFLYLSISGESVFG